MTSNLKEQVLLKISQTEDKYLLEEIAGLLEIQEPETTYTLSDLQQTAILEARGQISRGEFLTNDEVDKRIDH